MADELNNSGKDACSRAALRQDQPLLPYQQYFLDYQLYSPGQKIMNISTSCRIPAGNVDVRALKRAVDKVFHHYSILATIFTFNDAGGLVQRYVPDLVPDIQIFHTDEESYRLRERIDFVRPFRMLNSLLWRHQILVTEENIYLMVDFHHTIADKGTCMILYREIFNVLDNKQPGPDYYYKYLSLYALKMRSPQAARDLRELGELYDGPYSRFPKPDMDSRENTNARRLLQTDHTLEFYRAKAKQRHVSPGMAMCCAGLMALSRFNNKKKVQAEWLYHGRNEAWKKELAGLMLTGIPYALDFNKLATTDDIFREAMRQKELGRRFCDYSYAVHNVSPAEYENMRICYLTGNDDPGNMPEGSQMDVYVDALDGMMGLAQIIIAEGGENAPLTLICSYQGTRYQPESIDRLLLLFLEALNELLCDSPAGLSQTQ